MDQLSVVDVGEAVDALSKLLHDLVDVLLHLIELLSLQVRVFAFFTVHDRQVVGDRLDGHLVEVAAQLLAVPDDQVVLEHVEVSEAAHDIDRLLALDLVDHVLTAGELGAEVPILRVWNGEHHAELQQV